MKFIIERVEGMTLVYRKCLYLFACMFSFTAFAQTVIIENQQENDSLWSLGASDLLSFYLEEQGLKIANRDSLSAMTGEVDLADANFTKSSTKKGQWSQADFIITGQVNPVSDKGLFVQVSVTNVKNGQVLTKQQKQVKDEDQLAVEIEIFARLIGQKIAASANKKAVDIPIENEKQFLDAITLFKFYKAINLITEQREAEGIRELIYITHNSPNFTIPYYWLASFFRKYNYLKIAESIESTSPSLLNKNQLKGVYLVHGQSLPNNALQSLQNEIEKLGFYTLSPQSLLKLDLEKDLQHWRYIKGSQIAQLSSYLSAYTIKLNLDNKQNYRLTIIDSISNKVLTEFTSSDFSKVIEKLKSLNDSDQIKKLNDNPSQNKPKITSYTKGNQHEYLAYLIQQLMNKEGSSEDIWRLMSFYRTMHHREHLWKEILKRASKEELPSWELTHKYQIQDNGGLIGSPHNEFSFHDIRFLSFKHQDILKSLKPFKNNSLETQYAYIYNLAIEKIRNKKYHEALQQFNDLHSAHFKSLNVPNKITCSINYWKWLCAFKLKNDALEELYSSQVKQDRNSYSTYTYTGIIPIIKNGHIGTRGNDWQVSDLSSRWLYFSDDAIKVLPFGNMNWPEIPMSNPELKHTKNLYKFFDVFKYEAQKGNIPDIQLDRFYRALYCLDILPNAEINDEIKSLCYKSRHLFKPFQAKDIMCIIGDFKTAEEIIKSSRYPTSAKANWWMQVWRYNYDAKETYRKAANYMISSGEIFTVNRVFIESCFRYRLLDEVEKLVTICEKVKPNTEELQFIIAIRRADLAFYRGDMLKALQMYKELRLSRWANTIDGEVHTQEIKDYLPRKISLIESLNPNRTYTCTWEELKVPDITTNFGFATSTVALDVFTPEVRQDFTEIINTVHSFKFNQGSFYTTKTKTKIQDHLTRFINKHTDQSLPQFIRYLNYSVPSANKQVTEWLIEKMASQKNKHIILDAFRKNQSFATLAFKLDKNEAIKIFENNFWAIQSEAHMEYHLCSIIIKNKLNQYYSVLYDLCYRLEYKSREILYLCNKAHLKSASNDYQKYQKFLNKMMFEICPKIDLNDFRHCLIYKQVMYSSFEHGNRDGLKLLIKLLDKRDKDNDALLTPKYLFRFFQKVTKQKVKSVQEIEEIMSTLKWDQEKRKWIKP
ncbi:hypothetical protein LNTAR_11741 [Lentisphaera araneosa HTCC2155]|uniref:Uncharacterized protein n=1 Tax=Lentisphaera araneosa HTCC2155 TaxID=313628 RepID=A6DJE9_9BACT|nr:hypothetical protein [Lentisphaera araneosa]EDM28023.1 hypothetical protein LNTAR_11741 [Lentisphaera araneosa HTCC2155]